MAKKIDIKNLGRVLTEEINNISELDYKAYAFELFGEIVKLTPVQTGRARGNWHIETGRPYYNVTSNTQPSRPNLNLDLQGFPNIYISNGLHYIGDLEDGKSIQAPNGISKIALAVLRSRR